MSILITAYDRYDDWQINTSWLVLQEVLRLSESHEGITSRLYPVDFAEVKTRIASDAAEAEVAIHLGQAPGRSCIDFEAIGLNVARDRHERAEQATELVEGGPPAFVSPLPLGDWARSLRELGIPSEVSHYAGTYLCNAAHYLSNYHGTPATFLHLPLATEHAMSECGSKPSLPLAMLVEGVMQVVQMAKRLQTV